MRTCVYIIAFSCFTTALFSSKIPYTVQFEGVENHDILRIMKENMQLIALKKRPPSSLSALRYRAESDIPELITILHSYGYYEASVHIELKEIVDDIKVEVLINQGPLYSTGEYNLIFSSPELYNTPWQETLGIKCGKPALAEKFIKAELQLLQMLAERGYPLAVIKERDFIVDGKTKTLKASLYIETGACSRFGSTSYEGNSSVRPKLIEQKTTWKKGEIYKSSYTEETQQALFDTGLFSSVLITHDEIAGPDGTIPMHINVIESKHKNASVGVSYQTFYGPGLTFGWENNNISGMGRTMRLQADITKRSHSGIANLKIPDFRKKGQDYIWEAQAEHESIVPYSQRAYHLLNRLDRTISKKVQFSIGMELEKLYVTNSADNGIFSLIEIPLYVRWSSANSLLNPTKGHVVEYAATPSIHIAPFNLPYLVQQLTYSIYYPLSLKEFVVLAQQVSLGSIESTSLGAIPLPKRFLGGSEDNLRGYRYRSVSPLSPDGKPLGGKSAIFYTCELRLRLTPSWGLVPFFDLGNVYLTSLPTFRHKWFKSAGLGIRYFSFIGPLRLDIARALDRRTNFDPPDPPFRLLISMGQTF